MQTLPHHQSTWNQEDSSPLPTRGITYIWPFWVWSGKQNCYKHEGDLGCRWRGWESEGWNCMGWVRAPEQKQDVNLGQKCTHFSNKEILHFWQLPKYADTAGDKIPKIQVAPIAYRDKAKSDIMPYSNIRQVGKVNVGQRREVSWPWKMGQDSTWDFFYFRRRQSKLRHAMVSLCVCVGGEMECVL